MPFNVAAATEKLLCSSLLIVNITAHHNTLRSENWIYVYDEDKYTTRLHFTEKLSPFNAPENHTGVQVEVYYNRMKPLLKNYNAIGNSVIKELMEMRIIAPSLSKSNKISFHTKNIPWANIIFQHGTQDALNTILNWLTKYGLRREDDDLAPTTDWGKRSKVNIDRIALAGRFGQWKYFWTDDCVLRGSHISI